MRLSRTRGIKELGVGLAVVAATGLSTVPASATTLAVTAYCDSTGSNFDCFAVVSNGTAPYQYAWASGSPFYVITSSTTTQSINGACTPGHALTFISVTVTDSLGQTGSAHGSGPCNRGFP